MTTNHPYYLSQFAENAVNVATDRVIADAQELYRQGRWDRLTAVSRMRSAGAFEAEINEALAAVQPVGVAA